MLGEYDRRMVSESTPQVSMLSAMLQPEGTARPHRSTTVSTQRTRILSPGEIAKTPAGRALHLNGTHAELIALTPAHQVEPWRALSTHSA